MISAEQFQEWKNHPVTKELFTELKKARKELIDQLACGATIGSAEFTHGSTNRIVGHIEGLNQLLNISFEGDSVNNDVDTRSGY